MDNHYFVYIDKNKFFLVKSKLLNFYINLKNQKNLIKPLKKKINKINQDNLITNINKFNQNINHILTTFNYKNKSKIKSLIKYYFKTNHIQTNIIYKIIKNFKKNYNNNQQGGYIILDILGLIPIIGIPFDILSTIISLSEGDYFTTILSVAAIIPGLGTFPGIGKIGVKFIKTFTNFSSLFGTFTSFIPGMEDDENYDEEDYDEDDDEYYDDEDFDDEEYDDSPSGIIGIIDSFVPSTFKPLLKMIS